MPSFLSIYNLSELPSHILFPEHIRHFVGPETHFWKPSWLYIKRHSKTGLLYFGKTTQKDPLKYNGSGVKWMAHCNFHGVEFIETMWLMYFNSEIEFKYFATTFSYMNNIKEESRWANLTNEDGRGGARITSKEIFRMKMKQKYIDNPELRERISKASKQKYIDNPELRVVISEKSKKYHSSLSPEEKIKYGQRIREMRTGTSVSEETKLKISDTLKVYYEYIKSAPENDPERIKFNEARYKNSESLKFLWGNDEEYRQKMKNRKRYYGEDHWLYGKKLSEERRKQISDSNKKRWSEISDIEYEEMCNKVRGENNPRYGVHDDYETYKKISEKAKGMVTCKDRYGNTYRITKEEFDKRDDLFGINKKFKD